MFNIFFFCSFSHFIIIITFHLVLLPNAVNGLNKCHTCLSHFNIGMTRLELATS
nr:MAG TPA: hypothetical protein [Caudoviricetes sp.]